MNRKRALVVGGNSGIGLAVVAELIRQDYEHVYIAARKEVEIGLVPTDIRERFAERTSFTFLDLNLEDYSVLDEFGDIETLVITAGFGRVAFLENLSEVEIKNLVKTNELAPIQIIRKFYDKLKSNENFNCAVMVSIAGHIASPLFSVYGAAKAGLAAFIENVNAELKAAGFENRILDCSPGALKGTAFHGGRNRVQEVAPMAAALVEHMLRKETLFIPQFEEVYKGVLANYQDDADAFAQQSYRYKIEGGRLNEKSQVVIGYLSGTFDLFHVGHLNLLRRARAQCDYLIVGVHDSGAWKGKETYIPFEERKAILESVRYVDQVVMSEVEDSDAWKKYGYQKLFVGSDYKGSERFNRYEEYFKDKGVEIVYFPYTKGTSSTQLREALSNGKKK